MNEFSTMAGVLADPARAKMLMALMGGVALTATELASEADVAASTASSHLAALTDSGLVTMVRQGRHRYFRIVDAEVASMIEGMHSIATREPRRRGPSDPTLRLARVCYDHLAGEHGVWLFEQLRARDALTETLAITASGATLFESVGVELTSLQAQRRPLCRSCLDWSERRPHLAGSLAAALLNRVFTLGWARRETGSRAIVFSARGLDAFRGHFGGDRPHNAACASASF